MIRECAQAGKRCYARNGQALCVSPQHVSSAKRDGYRLCNSGGGAGSGRGTGSEPGATKDCWYAWCEATLAGGDKRVAGRVTWELSLLPDGQCPNGYFASKSEAMQWPGLPCEPGLGRSKSKDNCAACTPAMIRECAQAGKRCYVRNGRPECTGGLQGALIESEGGRLCNSGSDPGAATIECWYAWCEMNPYGGYNKAAKVTTYKAHQLPQGNCPKGTYESKVEAFNQAPPPCGPAPSR
jgi:hypothetical protein